MFTHVMLTNRVRREVFTAEEGVVEYLALQLAGAAPITIIESGGGVLTFSELLIEADEEDRAKLAHNLRARRG